MKSSITSILSRHQLAAFFCLAFGLNGLFWLPRAYLSHNNGSEPVMMTLHILGALMPCVAALIVTGLATGRAGVRQLFAPYLYWRVGAGWYAFVLLCRPLIWLTALAIYLALGLKQLAPYDMDWPFFAAYLSSQFIVVGVGEELGWMGFAYPRLKERWGFLAGGLALGVLWGLWHYPMFLTVGDSQYGSSLLLFVVKLTMFRLLFALAFDATSSLLITGLFHVSMNALSELVPLSPNDPLAMALLAAVTVLMTVRALRQKPKLASSNVTIHNPT